MSYVRTTNEFSLRRKVGYSSSEPKSPMALGDVLTNVSSHKSFYENDTYVIEFTIGDEFDLDDVTIKSEGQRLIVKGESILTKDAAKETREFKRDFMLPHDVDPSSVRASLNSSSSASSTKRTLRLVGKLKN